MSEEKIDAGLSFAELDLAPGVLQAVRDAGYTHPTPIQQQAIPLALAGRDLIGLAQTGTGKTAGFTLPIINNLISAPITDAEGEAVHRVRVLILTPTRELAAQVEESFRKYGKYTELRVVPIFGGVGIEPQSKALRRGVDVVVATPGRLLDHMERQNVSFNDLEVLVLDEADRMLDMGFRTAAQSDRERDPTIPADSALQRDDAARSRGPGPNVSAQAGRSADRTSLRGS